MPTWTEPTTTLRIDASGVYINERVHPLDALDQPPLRDEIARLFGLITLAEALITHRHLTQPCPPPTGEPCACGSDRMDGHPHLDHCDRFQDASAPVEYQITSARCRACGRWWTFEESGDTRYEYRCRARSFDPLGA